MLSENDGTSAIALFAASAVLGVILILVLAEIVAHAFGVTIIDPRVSIGFMVFSALVLAGASGTIFGIGVIQAIQYYHDLTLTEEDEDDYTD